MLDKKQLIATMIRGAVNALAVLFIAIVIVWFASRQITVIAKSLQEKRLTEAVFEKKSETVIKLQNDFESIGDRDKKVEEALLSSNNILEFVGILESLATRYALQQTIKFGVPVPVDGTPEGVNLSRIDYNITLTGNISTLAKYLSDFEALPYYTHASSVNLSTQSPQGWEDVSTITIQAKIYVKSSGN